ncbi:hypothetical protein [Nocardia sp. IFM 10818]
MEQEVVYAVVLRAIDEGSDDPQNPYAGVRFVEDGEPLAHAATPPDYLPDCGATKRVIPGLPWSDPLPAAYRRCPECLTAHPLS